MIYQNFEELIKHNQVHFTSDLTRFIDLYKSFGIECKISDCEEGFQIILVEDCYHSIDVATENKKIEGYNGFYTNIKFDKEGKFLKQGIWE